jgi:DNA-binding transcriptional ArsR family regulator
MSTTGPSLWRTYRVLAGETRLEMLRLLIERGELCVSDLAELAKTTPHNASTQLRALNARGLITPRREKQCVLYRAEADKNLVAAPHLLAAISAAFHAGTVPGTVFRLCTAFMHPRRIEIARILQTAPHSFSALQEKTGFSPSALSHHLEKLESRGFVKKHGTRYLPTRRNDPLRMALWQCACEGASENK